MSIARRLTLKQHCEDIRNVLSAGETCELSYKLYAKSLINKEARKSGDVTQIFNNLEDRFSTSESGEQDWEKLLDVFRGCDEGRLARKLNETLSNFLGTLCTEEATLDVHHLVRQRTSQLPRGEDQSDGLIASGISFQCSTSDPAPMSDLHDSLWHREPQQSTEFHAFSRNSRHSVDIPVHPSRRAVTKAASFEDDTQSGLSKSATTPLLPSSSQVSLQSQLLDRVPHLLTSSVIDYKEDLEGQHRRASLYIAEIRRLEKELSRYATAFREENAAKCRVEFELAHARQKIKELESENEQLRVKVLYSEVKMLDIKDRDAGESNSKQMTFVTGILGSK